MITVLVSPFEHEAIIARNQLYELRLKGFEELISEENENDTENEPKFEERKRKKKLYAFRYHVDSNSY